MVNSLLLAGLAGFAGTAQAHPHILPSENTGLVSRKVDLNQFRMAETGNYVAAHKVQSDVHIAQISKRASYLDTAKELVKAVAPDAEYRVVEDHYVGSDGVAHVYFKQTLHGIDIDNGDLNVNVGKDGKVFSYGSSFFKGTKPKDSPFTKRSYSDPAAALIGAIKKLGLKITTKDIKVEAKEGKENFVLTGTTGAVSHPRAKLVYLRKKNGELALTWRVETDVRDNWLLSYVDAYQSETIHNVVDYVSDLATYQVFPWTINDPTEGGQTVIKDPWNTAASPFTWLGDGQNNYTTTRGNNAIAQDNPSGGDDYENNYRPDSPDDKFEYPWDASETDPTKYKDASITQLFYTANKYHDLLYVLGFDEKAGNFQQNNNGKGGQGNDFVILFSQDGGGTNNANFATPPDGQSGVMRMYLWDVVQPQRDGCLDANVILHEYTHGCGPGNSGCLDGLESGGMGEGWSDFMATAIRLKTNDTRNTDYTIGAWVDNNPKGIREYPYSTNMKTNPMTYGTVNKQNEVHAIGTVWCTVLYEAIWNLIDKHGITAGDFPEFDGAGVPKDGRYLAMKIVMGGMALQPCNPNMVSARDAIIDADKALTKGANACELWKAFAKRGLGQKAKFGERKRTEDFTVPAGVCKS